MSADNFAPNVMVKLMKEIRSLHDNPIEGITLLVNDDSLSSLQADLYGPIGTPFEDGRFRVKLSLPSDYPASPPKGYFLTKIFHPNVSASGEICVNTLKKDWKPTHGLRHILLIVHCLLIQPNPESALNEEAGKLLMEAYEEYEKRARLMTKIHAVVKGGKESKQMPDSQGMPMKAKKESDVDQQCEGDEDGKGQENQPSPHVNSPSHAGGKRAVPLGESSAGNEEKLEEENKSSPKKRAPSAAVPMKVVPAKAIKKSMKRL